MKPIIIYTLPRSHSTAALQACRKPVLLNEPFDHVTLYGQNATEAFSFTAKYNNEIIPSVWPKILSQLNDKNSASKFFGHSLYFFLPARKWFQACDINKTHDIFILTRNLREQIFSYLLAKYFGYSKSLEKVIQPITIRDFDIFLATFYIDCFLRFYPQNGKIITFDKIPETHFDRNRITLQPQHSLNKLSYITNLDFVQDQVNNIIMYYRDEWVEKIGNSLL